MGRYLAMNCQTTTRLFMKPISIACSLAFAFACVTATPVAFAQSSPPNQSSMAATTQTAPKLHAALRTLWHGHLVATHDYAVAVHANNSAKAAKAADAVVANAKQIADAVAGFYGKDAGDGLLKLLAGHWSGVKALTDAAKAGDATGEQNAMSDLVSNGTAIAKFLAGANSNWTEGALQGALVMHVNDHKTQVDEMMSNAPAATQAKSWAEMQQHMNMIADVLSDGIALQFPDKAH
ncbi:hypothetical protein DWU99_15345 [Dyella psychrodurans]|uniref:DUF4142 domain-containing protein n=2 Tax=Dyella psychrodurans TaxID=1927960 RepID=A0A370X0I9_9GAMM|nr:hypothetical protein DWU99_15345 [Dyella psychrodurans]